MYHQAMRGRRLPTTGTLLGLPPGPAGIRRTLQIMADLASQAKRDPQIRELALDVVRYVRPKDYAGEAAAVFDWVRQNIHYRRDVRGVEVVTWPQKTLEYSAGDCDDMVTLLAALLEAIGQRVRFVAMGQRPGRFSHVFAEVLLAGEWVAMDPTEPVPFGWRPPQIAVQMVQEVA